LILGVLADKDWPAMCHILAPLAQKIYAVPVASARTAVAEEVAAFSHSANQSAEIVASKNFSEALNACQHEPFVVVAGSLYLIGEALEKLGALPSDGGERGLNEWVAKK
jgi:folylpolyglutamate synthase/dihydropteroate synthase